MNDHQGWKWASCGNKKAEQSAYCEKCRLDKYGFGEKEPSPQKDKNILNKKVHALET
ncbi:MAG: hypothetical protein QM610_00310 [Chitinophagaceae bacterium]